MEDFYFATTEELRAYGMRSGDALCRIYEYDNTPEQQVDALRNWYRQERQWIERDWHPSLRIYLP